LLSLSLLYTILREVERRLNNTLNSKNIEEYFRKVFIVLMMQAQRNINFFFFKTFEFNRLHHHRYKHLLQGGNIPLCSMRLLLV
jgi:hypothetical protein